MLKVTCFLLFHLLLRSHGARPHQEKLSNASKDDARPHHEKLKPSAHPKGDKAAGHSGGPLECKCLTAEELPHGRAEDGHLLLPAAIFGEEAKKKFPPDYAKEVNGKKMDFYKRPKDAFTYCKAWDQDTHPGCAGNSGKPGFDWCTMKWCMVSAECACGEASKTPGGNMSLPDATACPVDMVCNTNMGAKETKLVMFSYHNCEAGTHSGSYNAVESHSADSASLKQCERLSKKSGSPWSSSHTPWVSLAFIFASFA